MRSVGQRFRQVFTHEDGFRFHASLQPIYDMKIYSDDYFPVRQIMRVFKPNLVQPGSVVREANGQRYLLGQYDLRDKYQAFRCYPLDHQVQWTRTYSETDPLTGEPIGLTTTDLGAIWVLAEVVTREERGAHIRTREEVKRVLTNADVRLNDLLDQERVVKVINTLGIRLLEVV